MELSVEVVSGVLNGVVVIGTELVDVSVDPVVVMLEPDVG